MPVHGNHHHHHHHLHGYRIYNGKIPEGVLPFRGRGLSSHLQDLIEVVCRVSLTVFAFIFNPISTGVGLTLGLAYGLYFGHTETKPGGEIHQCDPKGGCGAGFLEELSGVRFPKVLNTLVAFGLTLEHLLHGCGGHGHISLPFNLFSGLAGLSSGAWIGRSLWHIGRKVRYHG